MKTESELEDILRQAPKPQPAPSLARTLKSKINLAAPRTGLDLDISLWRRWFPAIAYAILILGCVVVLAVQSSQEQELARQNDRLRKDVAVAQEAAEQRGQYLAKSESTAREFEQWKRDAAEARQLEERLARLQADLSKATAELQDLQASLAAVTAPTQAIAPFDFFGEDGSPLKQARAKAGSISCVNNLKQIGLAFRIWASDHDDQFPPNLNVLSNELSVLKVLCCPEDTANMKLAEQLAKLPGGGWQQWPLNGGSYEVLLASGLSENTPGIMERVMARCRIHGHVVLGDGSVHQGQNREQQNP